MKLEYNPLTEQFVLQGGTTHITLDAEDLTEQEALALLQQLKALTPRRAETSSRPPPCGLSPSVAEFVAAGGEITRYTRTATAWGIHGDLDRERERKAKIATRRAISSLSLEDLDLGTL